MRRVSKIIAAALCVASLGAFGTASAALVSFSNITGSWSAIDPAGITLSDNGTANPQMRWGTAATSHGQSGYDFNAASDFGVNVPPEQMVMLGSFAHVNNPIRGTSLNSAMLTVGINIEVDGEDQGLHNFMFDFTHEETPNGADPCANGDPNYTGVNGWGCADLVTISNSDLSEDFLVNGVLYTVAILGFEVDGMIVSTFETMEKMTNRAKLVGYITVSEVPIPAAIPLFLSGIVGLGFAGRRKKKNAA